MYIYIYIYIYLECQLDVFCFWDLECQLDVCVFHSGLLAGFHFGVRFSLFFRVWVSCLFGCVNLHF